MDDLLDIYLKFHGRRKQKRKLILVLEKMLPVLPPEIRAVLEQGQIPPYEHIKKLAATAKVQQSDVIRALHEFIQWRAAFLRDVERSKKEEFVVSKVVIDGKEYLRLTHR